jgi:hypothetical protein
MRRSMSSFLLLGSSALMLCSTGNTQELQVETIPAPKQMLANPTPASCCNSSPQKIIVEVPPPEIIIQRAGGVCAPEPMSFLQRCNHFRIHQWTHSVSRGHGHSAAPVNVIPMMVAPQSYVPQSFAPQSFVPQSFAPQAFIPQSFVPQSFAPQAFVPQSFVPQSFVPQSFVPQSFAPQSFVPQSFVPQACVPQSVAPQSFAPQSGSADDRMDIRDAVKKLSENMEAATKLLKGQAQILKIHDDAIATMKTDLDAAKALLAPLSGHTLSVDATTGNVKAKKN